MVTKKNSDLRVSVELGLAINLGEYNSLKPLVRIDGIDPHGNVEEQLQAAVSTSLQAWITMDGAMEQAITNLGVSAPDAKSKASERLKALEGFSAEAREALSKLIPAVSQLMQDRNAKAS